MKRTHTIIGVFIATYGAILTFPLSYLLSPFLTAQQHQFLLGVVALLALPAYVLGVKHFGLQFITPAIKYGVLYGRPIQRFFLGFVMFFVFGLVNGLIATAVTGANIIPFAIWNPYIEGLLLIVTLFALILQSALIQYFKDNLSMQRLESMMDNIDVDEITE